MKNPKGYVDWEAAVMRSTQTFEQRCQQHATQTAACSSGAAKGERGVQGDRQGKQDTAYKPQDTWQTEGQTVDVFCLCAMLRTLMTVKIYRKDSTGRGGGGDVTWQHVMSLAAADKTHLS